MKWGDTDDAASAARSATEWCDEPVTELDPEPREHPILRPPVVGPESAPSSLRLRGLHAEACFEGRTRWRSFTGSVQAWMFTRRPWSRLFAWPRTMASAEASAPSRLRRVICWRSATGWLRRAARTWQWNRLGSTGSPS